MPTSESDYLTLSNGMASALSGIWCGIKENPTIIHGLRTSASSTITIYYNFLLSTGSHSSGTFAISSNNVWTTANIDSSDAVGCEFWYSGTLGSGNYVYLYFT